MSQNLKIQQIQQKVIEILKTINDPEVGINIWDFGLIYGVNIENINVKNNVNLEKDLGKWSENCQKSETFKNQILSKLLDEKNQENKENELNKLEIYKNEEKELNNSQKFEAEFCCKIIMTFTSVNCPAIDLLPREIKEKIGQILKIETKIEIVWSPKWEINLLSEEIQFELGIL